MYQEIKLSKIGATLVALATLTTGCVKVQLLPEDVVKNTWEAGKNLYDERKIKNDGGEKKEYSSQINISDYSSRTDAETSCMESLKNRLKIESTEREPIITSEKIFIADGLENKVIECQAIGFIWQKTNKL